jgi:hypothetical protein
MRRQSFYLFIEARLPVWANGHFHEAPFIPDQKQNDVAGIT